MARVSMYDMKTATRAKRDGWNATRNKELVAKAKEVVAKAQNIPAQLLTAWDKESLRLVSELADRDSVEQLRREISRLMELAGVHYGISEKQFWQRYHARKNVAETDK